MAQRNVRRNMAGPDRLHHNDMVEFADAEINRQHMRRFMVPVRRVADHRRGRSRSRNRHDRNQHGHRMDNEGRRANNALVLPPSPPGFSSDSFGEDSDFSSYSENEDDLLNQANVRIRRRHNGQGDGPIELVLPNNMRVEEVHIHDTPSTSHGPQNRGSKRRISSSSDSCVETGFSIKYDAVTTGPMLQLAKNLQRLRQDEQFTDVKLVVGDREIACHRVVLAACSKYFHALLRSNMRECQEDKVFIQGHRYEIIELIVKHVYAESIQVQADNVQDIVEAADYFQLDQLKANCENFLLRQVAETNCLGLMQFGELHSLISLSNKAKKYALTHFLKVSKQEEFLRLPLSVLQSYLSDNGLAVQREEHVFHAAISWLQNCNSRTEHILNVLKCVRFLFVSPHFLFDTVAKHPMLQNIPGVQELVSEAGKYIALGCNEWKQMQLPHTRPRHAYGITEVLFIVGGICNNRRLHHAEYYHPQNGWISLADIITPHCTMHSYSVCAQKNNVYVTGGHCNSGLTANAASLYLSNINQWNELAGMLTPRERHGSATAEGAVYVAGGLMASQKGRKKPIVLDQVERYRPSFNQWEAVKPLPKRCYSPGVISYKEKLYVIGGVSMTEEPNNSSKVILDCIQRYDPLTDHWDILPLGRTLARLCCTLFQDHIYMISNNASHIFKYNPNTCTLQEWRELPEPGLEFAGLATFNGNLVITGGQKENHTLDKMFIISYETTEIIKVIGMTRPLCMHGCVAIDKFG